MTKKLSRRTLMKGGIVAGAALATPLAMALTPESDLADVEKGLAHPLTPENKKLAIEAFGGVRDTSRARLKHKLTENSEPSLSFSVRPGATTKW